MITQITEKETQLTNALRLMTETLTKTTQERDALRKELDSLRTNRFGFFNSQIQSNRPAPSSKIEA